MVLEEKGRYVVKARIIEFLSQYGLPPEIAILVVAILPIFELRGAIPVGINYLGLPWPSVFLFAVLGNMIPVPLLLIVFNRLVRIGEKIKFFRKILTRTERRGKVVDHYKMLGLIIFVGIPLPVTGAWTGALAARIFGIPFLKAMLGILGGVLIAGVIVTTLSLLGVIGAIIAALVLFAIVIRPVVQNQGVLGKS